MEGAATTGWPAEKSCAANSALAGQFLGVTEMHLVSQDESEIVERDGDGWILSDLCLAILATIRNASFWRVKPAAN